MVLIDTYFIDKLITVILIDRIKSKVIEMGDEVELCILCETGFSEENPSVHVKEKGLKTLLRLSKERKLTDLQW